VIFHILEKSVVTKGRKFSLCALKYIGISILATEAHSSLDLTKAKCNISRLRWRGDVIVRISPSNFSAFEKKKIDMTMRMKFAINMHTQILNAVFSQYKGISESVLIMQNVRLPGKRDD
jgi:hypothetical protein